MASFDLIFCVSNIYAGHGAGTVVIGKELIAVGGLAVDIRNSRAVGIEDAVETCDAHACQLGIVADIAVPGPHQIAQLRQRTGGAGGGVVHIFKAEQSNYLLQQSFAAVRHRAGGNTRSQPVGIASGCKLLKRIQIATIAEFNVIGFIRRIGRHQEVGVLGGVCIQTFQDGEAGHNHLPLRIQGAGAHIAIGMRE
ncbi:hypothetical protein SDC9_139682 [bioreactor metagenome]|uniref:Uncharacterized protein n=1 Tax=bioreactor metagenome TaxID=1076179 RepID=A0A645DT60_9ZZZZ